MSGIDSLQRIQKKVDCIFLRTTLKKINYLEKEYGSSHGATPLGAVRRIVILSYL